MLVMAMSAVVEASPFVWMMVVPVLVAATARVVMLLLRVATRGRYNVALLAHDLVGRFDRALNLCEKVVIVVNAGVGLELRGCEVNGRVALAAAR